MRGSVKARIPIASAFRFLLSSMVDYYTKDDAHQAIQYAQRIYDAVEQSILDLDAAIDELRTCAERLRTERDAVVAVYLFGSLAAGTATPHSDADLLVEGTGETASTDAVDDTARRMFTDAPLPVDLFVRPSCALTSDAAHHRKANPDGDREGRL